MSDFSTQQKVQLTRQVRERYQQDRQDLGAREQLLYGRTSPAYFDEGPDPIYESPMRAGGSGTLGLRILLAAILLCLLALADRRGDTLFGLTGGQIAEYLGSDYIPGP